MFLLHAKTKNDLTIYLAEKALTNFENVNGGYAVIYTTKCISNLEDFEQNADARPRSSRHVAIITRS